jgi:hypothetical protein
MMPARDSSWLAGSFARTRALLRTPLFGTTVVRSNATVRPELFPEEEYPVHCPGCGYLLRGLPDGKCPECGAPFDRGRLLVRQYVQEWQGAAWRHSAAGKWCSRLIFTGIALPVLVVFAVNLVRWLGYLDVPAPPSPAMLDWLVRAAHLVAITMFISPLLYVAAFAVAILTYPRGARKRRRAVLRAIGNS